MAVSRIKISVSLPRDLVARIDSAARGQARSRSRVLESWLRATSLDKAAQEVEAATIAYYGSLTDDDRHEEEALATASSRAARRLHIDDTRRSASRRRTRR